MSLRALILGGLLGVLVASLSFINDQVLQLEAMVAGQQLPVVVVGPILLALLVANPLLRLVRPGWVLRPAELAGAMLLMLVTCNLSGRGAADFNVCGDEPFELGQGRSRRRAVSVGKGQLYLEYMLKLHRLCRAHGKRMNMWADAALEHPELLGRYPKDVCWATVPAGCGSSWRR